MPNYVKNILSFDGDPVQVDRLFSAIQGDKDVYKRQVMCFNKQITIPVLSIFFPIFLPIL